MAADDAKLKSLIPVRATETRFDVEYKTPPDGRPVGLARLWVRNRLIGSWLGTVDSTRFADLREAVTEEFGFQLLDLKSRDRFTSTRLGSGARMRFRYSGEATSDVFTSVRDLLTEREPEWAEAFHEAGLSTAEDAHVQSYAGMLAKTIPQGLPAAEAARTAAAVVAEPG